MDDAYSRIERFQVRDLLESFNLVLASFEFVVRYSSETSHFRASLLTQSIEMEAATTSQSATTSMEMDAISALHMIAQQELETPQEGPSATSLLDAMPHAAKVSYLSTYLSTYIGTCF